MNFLKLTHDVLNVAEISDQVLHESCGAVSVFIGTTRDNFVGRPVTTLEYEAYEPMALSSMDTICTEIRKRWPQVKHIAMYHRLGFVAVKEASVIIALSSPHRLDSMHAVEYAMDRTKSTVPIWKKEYYGKEKEKSQESQWKQNKECQWSQQ